MGDHFGPYALDAVSNEIPLDGKYIFYGKEQTSLFVSIILYCSLLCCVPVTKHLAIYGTVALASYHGAPIDNCYLIVRCMLIMCWPVLPSL